MNHLVLTYVLSSPLLKSIVALLTLFLVKKIELECFMSQSDALEMKSDALEMEPSYIVRLDLPQDHDVPSSLKVNQLYLLWTNPLLSPV